MKMSKNNIVFIMILSMIFISQFCFAESNSMNGIWVIDQQNTINELTKYKNENKVKNLLSKFTQPLAWQSMAAFEIKDEIINLGSILKKDSINDDKKHEYKLNSEKNNIFEYISTDNEKQFDKFKIEYVDNMNIKIYHSDNDGFDKILWKRATSDEINLSPKETNKIFNEWVEKIFALKKIAEGTN